jgi:anti-sigma factor RsiW
MECSDARELLGAHIDREIGGRETLEIERHLKTCVDCRARHDAYTSVRTVVGKGATRFRAPDALERRMLAALPPSRMRERQATVGSWRWLALGSALASMVAIVWSVSLVLMQPSADDIIVDEIISNHARSLLTGRIVDVASSDQHTVKPWFNTRIDYSPPVHDLTAEGFPLVGGRMDYLDHRPTAALVYHRHQHTINLLIAPAPPGERDSGPRAESKLGFHVVHWVRGGMAFWAVSDTEAGELEKFREALLSQQ